MISILSVFYFKEKKSDKPIADSLSNLLQNLSIAK